MKLSYRGVQYEATQPTLEVTEGEILGKYRGATWRCHTLDAIPVPQYDGMLKYRGVAYNPCRPMERATGAINRVKASRPVSDLTTAAIYEDMDRVHRANLTRLLERRLQAARIQGDETLIQLLEAESQQLALYP